MELKLIVRKEKREKRKPWINMNRQKYFEKRR